MAAPLQIAVHVAFSSGYKTPAADRGWTDVSQYVEAQSDITITYGRNDEFSTTDANRLTGLMLDNRDGRFTLDNPASPYYPFVLVGRPIRVLLGLLPNPDFEVDTSGWAGTNAALARVTTPVNSGSGALRLTASSAATMSASTPSGTSGQPVVPGEVLVVGAFKRTATTQRNINAKVSFYTAAGAFISTVLAVNSVNTTSYSMTEGDVTVPATAAFAQLTLEVISPASGEVHYFDDILFHRYRFTGYVDGWPVEWPGGGDTYSTATIQASSRISRLGLDTPIVNGLERTLRDIPPDLYWPMTEPEMPAREVEERAPALSGNPAVIVFGAGQDASAPSQLFDCDGKTVVLTLPGQDPPGSGAYARLAADINIPFSGNITFGIFVRTLTPRTFAGGFQHLVGFMPPDNSGALSMSLDRPEYSIHPTELEGVHHLAFTREQTSPTTFTLTNYLDGQVIRTTSGTAAAYTTLVSAFVSISHDTDSFEYGRFTMWDRVLTLSEIALVADAGLGLFSGDTTDERLQRIATWSDIPAAEVVTTPSTITVSGLPHEGAQALTLMRAMETTEAGVLHDDREGRLVLEHRTARYNTPTALVVDVATQQLGRDYAPKADRQGLANIATGKNAIKTVEVTVTDEASRDEYGDAAYNVETHALNPEEPMQLAALRVNSTGTPRPRAPSATLRHLDWTGANLAALLNLDIGSKIEVANRPAQAGATSVKHFIEGYTETLSPFEGEIALNLSPGTPVAEYFVLDSATSGVLNQNRLAL